MDLRHSDMDEVENHRFYGDIIGNDGLSHWKK